MSPLQIQWDRIRRRWVLILVIGLVAAAGALGASLLQGTSYTGRAALTIVSQDRAPEQDTVLAQGYADYFNQASSQEVLRQGAGLPDSVALNARIAAASPIVYVEATTSSPEAAQDAATKMAIALRDDVNSSLGGAQAGQVELLQQQLAQAQARNDSGAVSDLQEQINNLTGNSTNQLQDLQLTAGVAQNPNNALRNAGAALGGGLLFGILLAIALGRFENRIVTPSEVRDRLGLQVLAVIGGRRRSGEDARSQLLRSLMGLTNAYGMPTPGSLAITGPTSTRGSKSHIAVSLAGLRALQGQTTLLVQADLDGDRVPSELSALPGVSDFLAERGVSRIEGKVFTNGRALLVAPPGSRRDDLFALFSKSQIQRLLTQGNSIADLVIIDAPPVESVEGQVVCSAADRSLLVIEEGETRARDASAALDALGRIGGTALGAVVVRNPGQLNDPGFLKESNWNPVRLPAPAPAGRPGPPPGHGPGQGGPEQARPSGQIPPADRTQPISQKKLDEAREALARDPGNVSGVVAGAAAGASAASNSGMNSGTNGHANGTNGAARDTAVGGPVRRDAKTGDGPRPGPAGAGDAGSDSSSGQERPARPGPAPRGGPAPTRGAGPAGGATPGGSTGAKPAGTPSGGSAPGAGNQPSAGKPGANQAPGAKPAGASAAPSVPSAPGVKPNLGTKPAAGPVPAGAPATGGKPSPGSGKDTPAADGAGLDVRVSRRTSGGTDQKPSPRPKPGEPPASRGGPGTAGGPTSSPADGSSVPKAPGSPKGSKRVGTARFTSRNGGTGPAPANGAPERNGGGSDDGKQDRLSAPTVTLRTEK